tara:strand:- start:111582 stop:112685 length:1104 start_codon:yes stop_codon:yes gene_type:complete
MNKSFKSEFDEPLWAVPSSVSDRLKSQQKNSEYTAFVFCGIYCAVAVIFLTIFGVAALQRGEQIYAGIILGFAFATAGSYAAIWLLHYYFLAKHITATLMGILCLYLFYTGGTEGTGPVFYMVFPMVAVFLQGFAIGSLYIITLTILTILIYATSAFGFDREIYSFIFISRIATVYAITAFLAAFYSYFKFLNERELLFINEDLEQLSFADQNTGIANRNLMGKLLNTEYKRYQRYGFKFSLMLIGVNSYTRIKNQYGQDAGAAFLKNVAELLQTVLREPDIPSLWEREEFLILMPHTGLESARLVASRIVNKVASHQFKIGVHTESSTVSVGLVEVSGDELASIIQKLELYLYQATKEPSGNIVSG